MHVLFSNVDKLAFIKKWQESSSVPMLCLNSKHHRPLIGVENNDYTISLFCLDCGYRQNYIPDAVYNTNLNIQNEPNK